MYLVFAGDSFYPDGGINDLQKCFDVLEEALEFVENIIQDESTWPDGFEWSQIYCVKTGRIWKYGKNELGDD